MVGKLRRSSLLLVIHTMGFGTTEDVKDRVGHAPWFAQTGRTHDSVKALKGFGGARVLEVVESSEGNAYRAVYTVKFEGYVYVLHCFQKKSKRGMRNSNAGRQVDRVSAEARGG